MSTPGYRLGSVHPLGSKAEQREGSEQIGRPESFQYQERENIQGMTQFPQRTQQQQGISQIPTERSHQQGTEIPQKWTQKEGERFPQEGQKFTQEGQKFTQEGTRLEHEGIHVPQKWTQQGGTQFQQEGLQYPKGYQQQQQQGFEHQKHPDTKLRRKMEELNPYGASSSGYSTGLPSIYSTKLKKIFRGRVLVLPHNYTVSQALEQMSQYNVTSVPIIKTEGGEKFLLGFLDTLDILAFLCRLSFPSCEGITRSEIAGAGTTGAGTTEKEIKLSEHKTIPLEEKKTVPISSKEEKKKEFKEGPIRVNKKQIEKLSSTFDEFKKTTIEGIIDYSGRNPFCCLNEDCTLQEAVENYIKGVFRIAVVDRNNELTGVISQWAIVNYLIAGSSEDREWMQIYKSPVSKSLLKNTNVQTVNCCESVMNCFLAMHYYKLTALPVISIDTGKLLGNISASDLKGMNIFQHDAAVFASPVKDFLSHIRRLQNRPDNFVCSVNENEDVLTVMKKMKREVVHRVYVVDSKGFLTGVIALSDIMRGFVAKDLHSTSSYSTFLSQLQPEQRQKMQQLEKGQSF